MSVPKLQSPEFSVRMPTGLLYAVALVCAIGLQTPARGQSQAAPAGEVIDRVLAVASGVVITLTDVLAARDFGLASADGDPDPIRGTLTQLIERSLILSEVDRYGPPDPEESEILNRLMEIRARFTTPAAFGRALARVGLEERHLRELIRQNLRIRTYLDQRFTLVPVNEEQALAFYREHPERYARGARLAPFEEVRQDAARAAAEARRQTAIDQWVAGLRRRAEVIDVYAMSR